jgi:peroxiredoxin
MPDFDAAGIAVFALSYDPVEVLAQFVAKRDITYTLLSDVGSRVIRQLGLLNEHLDEQYAYYGLEVREHHRGVPYPGSFILDEAGVIVEKHFEQGHRIRPTGVTLWKRASVLPARCPPWRAA